ncbi:hypothetical protein ACHHZ9_25195, partial [Enterobacter cloacae complex sp. 2024EL-00232]|uniref:hypothetical protein n=1 Tax=unclassified Enterobacter cloacae complex TaxID=2757714 RepID=UPI001E644E94
MALYYVNTNKQANGDNEVHVSGCTYLPSELNRRYLGSYDYCSPAVTEAKRLGYNANGCYFCCKPCGLAPIFPYTFYHLTHDWFVAADIPVANDTPVHYADAIRCNV